MFPDETVTPRLRLRALSRAAVDPLGAYNHLITSRSGAIEEKTESVTWGPHETPKEMLEFLEQVEEGHGSVEDAVYAVFPRDDEDGTGELVGTARFDPEWDKRRAVLGMWLRKEFWGRGYPGKWATALFTAVFDVLDLDMALAYTMPENEVSCRVIERYTDRFDGGEDGLFPNETVDTDSIPCNVRGWLVTHEQWETTADGNYDVEFRWSLDPSDVR